MPLPDFSTLEEEKPAGLPDFSTLQEDTDFEKVSKVKPTPYQVVAPNIQNQPFQQFQAEHPTDTDLLVSKLAPLAQTPEQKELLGRMVAARKSPELPTPGAAGQVWETAWTPPKPVKDIVDLWRDTREGTRDSEKRMRALAQKHGIDPDTVVKLPGLAKQIGTGAGDAVVDLAETFMSPAGALTLGTSALPRIAQKAISIGFAAQMLSQAPEQAQGILEEISKPSKERNYQKIAQLAVGGLASVGLGGLAALHGIKPKSEELAEHLAREIQGRQPAGQWRAQTPLVETGQRPAGAVPADFLKPPSVVTETGAPAPITTPQGESFIQGVRPAVRTMDGKIHVGDKGDAHNDIISREKLEPTDIDRRLFVDGEGNEISREQLEAIGIKSDQPVPGAHAPDLAKVQEETPLETVKRVSAMSPDEFAKLASFNKINFDLGAKLNTKEGVTALIEARDKAIAEHAEAIKKLAAEKTPENMQAVAILASKPQFFNEAIESALGLSELKATTPPDIFKTLVAGKLKQVLTSSETGEKPAGGAYADLTPEQKAKSDAVKNAMAAEFAKLKAKKPSEPVPAGSEKTPPAPVAPMTPEQPEEQPAAGAAPPAPAASRPLPTIEEAKAKNLPFTVLPEIDKPAPQAQIEKEKTDESDATRTPSGITPGNRQPSSGGSRPPRSGSSGIVGGKQPQTGEAVGSGGDVVEPAPRGEPAGAGGAGKGASGGGQPPVEPRNLPTPRGAEPQPGGVKPKNYVITDKDRLGQGSLATKKADNMAAIRLVKKLEAENRLPTVEEQAILARYVGWGGLKGAMVEGNKAFENEFAELQKILTPEEYEGARASIQDAHYTSQTIIQRGLYAAMKRFGFKGGKMVEGGVGIGNMIGLMPEEMRAGSSYVGVERDPITAKIAKYLYPEANILQMGFQDAKLTRNHFDGAVGNPPFGNKAIYDKNHPESSKFTIHNFFIAKTLELMRPGATSGFVVSRYFLDALDPAARKYIARMGEFLGAIRLPNTAFKENAGTQVVTDLVFFKRRPTPLKNVEGEDWAQTVEYKDPKSGVTWPVNKWIAEHPEMVLGEITSAGRGLYGKDELTVEPTSLDLGKSLDEAVLKLPENVYENLTQEDFDRLNSAPDSKIPIGVRSGNFFVDESGNLRKRVEDVNGQPSSTAVENLKPAAEERIRAIIPLRDAYNQQIKLEQSPDASPKMIEDNRKKLNKLYDDFVKRYGYLNSSVNRRAFFDDNDVFRVLGLERDYSSGIGSQAAKKQGIEVMPPSAKKADIFAKRVNMPFQEVTSVKTAPEALAVSLNQRGMVDLDYMASLSNIPKEQLANELADQIFNLPEGGYETKARYLSGNVRRKLAEAEAAGDEFARNVEELKKVIPKDIDPAFIKAPVGAPWIAPDDIADFARELTGTEPSAIAFLKSNGGWLFEHRAQGVAETQEYGTPRMPFGELFKAMLNGKQIVVYDVWRTPEGERREINQVDTAAVVGKSEIIKQKWDDWLWRDEARRTRLHRVYNDSYNNYVDYRADGSHMTLPGSANVVLRKHQQDVAWRMITDGGQGLLLDHVVGAGKTFAGVAGMMELRRLGRVRKWLVPVPNHLTGQWADAFAKMYPNSNILAARNSDFSKANRNRMIGKILSGNFDAVIIGHSVLKKIATSPEIEKDILNEMLREITDTIRDMKAAEKGRKRDSRAVAQMEKTKDNIKAKLDRLANIKGRDVTATFDEMGFDGLFLDEAHEFKNLFYTTQMQNIAGLGNPAGSGRAFDLYLKTRFLKKQYGGKAPVVFATGTPISNSLVEMFTMQRYLQPEVLEEMNLKTLDAWARVFADISQDYEVSNTGVGMQLKTRFRNFQNVGELTGIYRNMADVILPNDLQTQAASRGERFPTPKMTGGKPRNIVAKRTPEQAAFMGVERQKFNADGTPELDSEGNEVWEYPVGSLLWRADNMPKDPKEDNFLKLTSDAKKASLDMRILNPSAPDRPESKPNQAVNEIVRKYNETTPQRGTQLVFCDLSVPSSHKARLQAKEHPVFIRDQQGDLQKADASLLMIGDASFNIVHVKGTDPANSGYVAYEANTGTHTKIFAHDKKTVTDTLRQHMAKPDAKDWLAEIVGENQAITDEDIAAFNDSHEEAEEVETGTTIDELSAMRSNFSVYDDMRNKLVAKGIPANEIAFIHDYDTPEKKQKLFKMMNAGDIRVLFGSTAKMGAGMNVQERIVALHHLDAPWKPAELEQRDGRAIRQGNRFYEEAIKQYKNPLDYDKDPKAFSVDVNRYATDLTYDARLWQILESKAVALENFRRADRNTRTLEDVDSQAASASEMKAAVSGDPLIAREIKLRTEKKKLEMLAIAFRHNMIALQDQESWLSKHEERYASATAAAQRLIEKRDNNTKLDEKGQKVFELKLPLGKGITTEKGEPVDRITKEIKAGNNTGKIGVYRGFYFDWNFRPKKGEYQSSVLSIHAEGEGSVTSFWDDDPLTGVGLFQRLDNWMDGFDARLDAAKSKRDAEASELSEIKKQTQKTFGQGKELENVSRELAAVQTQLTTKKKGRKGPAAPETDLGKGDEPLGPGLGAAIPSEFAKGQQTPTSIKNAQVDKERQSRGLPPAIEPAKRSFGTVWDAAMASVDNDPEFQDRLIESLATNPRSITDLEDALLLHRQIELQNEYGKLTRDLAQAYDDAKEFPNRMEQVAELKARTAGLRDRLFELYEINKRVGTETARGLNARKMMAYEDFSLAQMELDKRESNGGKPLTEQQAEEIKRLHDEIAARQKAYDEYVENAKTRISELEAKKSLDEIEKEAEPVDEHIQGIADRVIKAIETQANAARERIKARRREGRLMTGLDPTDLADHAMIGAEYIVKGAEKFSDWSVMMVKEFGDYVKPHLKKIFNAAQKYADRETVRQVSPQNVKKVRRAIEKKSPAEQRGAIRSKIADRIDSGRGNQITSLVRKLARSFIEDGVNDREELIDAVHNILTDIDPNITRRDTMDAISGYGDFKQLSKDEVSLVLRDLKGQMQQIAKLEDMRAGEPPLKTGLERRTPSKAERELIKLVNEAKRKFQIPVQDPNTQLKSALDTLKSRMQTRIEEYEKKLAEGDFAPKPAREPLKLDEKARELKGELERAKGKFLKGLQEDRLKNRPWWEKAQDTFVKWRRGFLLSSPITLAKLTSAAVQRMTFTPAEELVGAGLSMLPKVSEVSARAPREGGGWNARAEAKAISEAFTKGMKDAWDTLKTGQSELDILYGGGREGYIRESMMMPRSVIDFFGQLHGMLKAPTKRAEFSRAMEKRTAAAIRDGIDVSDPMVQTRLAVESYKDAQRSIFLQDNRVVTAYKMFLSGLESKSKETGKPTIGGKIAATTARVALPIVRVPTNIVAETFQYAFGSLSGGARLAAALARGIETLKPNEADLIMRQLKKGSLGAAVMLTGFLLPNYVGGYYQPGDRRKEGDLGYGRIRIGDWDVPSYLLHNPLLETLQLGATIRRVSDTMLHGEKRGIPAGIMAGSLGLADEVPFVREMFGEVPKMFNPSQQGAFFGELGKSMLVPQVIQFAASQSDKDAKGNVTPRKPNTVWQHIESGIPFLRQNVPLKNANTNILSEGRQ